MNILTKQQGMDLIAAAVYLECHGGAQSMPVAEANRIAQTLRDLLAALGSQCKPGGRCERHARGLGACVAGYCNPPAPAPARQPLPFDDDVPEDLRAVLEKHFGVGAHKAWNRAASLDACMMRAAGLAAVPTGYALVPLEPTPAMFAATAREDERTGDFGTMKYRRGIWKAMVRAASVEGRKP